MEQVIIKLCQVFTYKYVDFSMNRAKICYLLFMYGLLTNAVSIWELL